MSCIGQSEANHSIATPARNHSFWWRVMAGPSPTTEAGTLGAMTLAT
jgi:hypothetical protein